MAQYPHIEHTTTLEPLEDLDTTINARPPPPSVDSSFCQRQVEWAIKESLNTLAPLKMDDGTREAELGEAKRLHDADLYKTQYNYQKGSVNDGSVLVLVKFPESRSATSCRYTSFNTGRIRLTYEQVLNTGSDLLADLLVNERHQRLAKKAAAPLPEGIEYVLDLSPTTDENDYTIALQWLSTPHAVQLWHRSMAFGTSPLAVAGHDDVCTCLIPFDDPYPSPTPPESIKSQDQDVCIFDTNEWPLEENRKIDDFCTTRWAANTLRLFRAISMPPGQKDLVIDSAPRMWTLVGLFAKLEMTNYDILRDEVVAWFNANLNHAFVELCPEETLHIGLVLRCPLLTEPAFRILVNERALEVAGGQPRSQAKTTLFGRRCSDFTGTDVAESISRMIEHASCAMTERYKSALDGICGDHGLDLLQSPEWQELRALEHTIPKERTDISIHHIRVAYDHMMTSLRHVFRDSVERVIERKDGYLPFDLARSSSNDRFRLKSLTVAEIEEKRAFSVPKGELLTTQSFETIYNNLNRYQRALIPIIWHDLKALADDRSAWVGKDVAAQSVMDFKIKFERARREGKLFGPMIPEWKGDISHGSGKSLFTDIMTKLKTYVSSLITRDEHAFVYTMSPHLVLALDDHEMNFLRLADDEGTFQTEAPETDLGPSGPGPAFHTGQTVPSVSDLDFEKLAIEPVDDDVSTIGGSMAAQDGVSTVYHRHRVLVRSAAPSIVSEAFTTGDDMSADYAEAEYQLPTDHQGRGQYLARTFKQANDEEDDGDDDEEDGDLESLDLGLDEDSDFETVMCEDDVDEAEPSWAERAVDDCTIHTTIVNTASSEKEFGNKTDCADDSDDSDFEVIKKDESVQ